MCAVIIKKGGMATMLCYNDSCALGLARGR